MKNHFCIQKPYLHTKNHIDCPKIDCFIDKKALATKFLIQTVYINFFKPLGQKVHQIQTVAFGCDIGIL